MKKIVLAALSLSFVAAAPAFAEDAPVAAAATRSAVTPVVATKGKMIVAVDGSRLAPVYRVSADGAQIILDGRMVTVPADTLAMVDGKLTTSLTKGQVVSGR